MRIILLCCIALCFTQCNPSSQAKNSPEAQSQSQAQVQFVNYTEVDDFISKTEGLQVIDVRTEDEHVQGFLTGSKNMEIRAHDFADQLSTLDKDKPVLVYCARGGRSGRASKMLQDMGFSEIYDLKGGYNKYEALNR